MKSTYIIGAGLGIGIIALAYKIRSKAVTTNIYEDDLTAQANTNIKGVSDSGVLGNTTSADPPAYNSPLPPPPPPSDPSIVSGGLQADPDADWRASMASSLRGYDPRVQSKLSTRYMANV